MNLNSDITTVKGVGEKSATLFHKLHIKTVKDLLFYYPRDYETFLEPVAIADLKEGSVAAVKAVIIGTPVLKKIRNLNILTATVKDQTGAMQLTFFNMPYLKNALRPGSEHVFYGMIQSGKKMEQPRIYKEEEYRKLLLFIQPKYSVTKGLTSQAIGKAVRQILSLCPMPSDPLPKELLEEENLMNYREALCAIHFPKNMDELLEARRRLVFQEFFSFIFMLREAKESTEEIKNTVPMVETAETSRFLEKLPYRLTNAQLNVIREICADMTGDKVMSRLVQGDVGSGKTIVAIWSLLLCVSNGYQGAMMAPTEVLAKQHFEAIKQMTKEYGLPFKPVLLTGSQTASSKKEIYKMIENGEANLVIGTHAVIQENVHFQNLALVVTDEQHRFGVRQRENLKEKGVNPHVLVMSATPIPRTLAIILYGDLHISVIDELPSGRKAIKNCVVGPEYRKKAYDFITKEVESGHQVYCICPMVEEGELSDAENVLDYTEKLRAILPTNIQIASLHGRMKPTEKNRIMEEYALGKIDVLVSTTVIEVGINVPNATVMMIENAERFGLAQLHQLRGRVGRGDAQSYCIFLSTSDKKETMERLSVLNKSNDGFYIASEDLKLRGPGDLFGVRQSGALEFKLGDIYNDASILKQAADCADRYKNEVKIKELVQNGTGMVDFSSI